jgi:hypothetical protein
MDPPAIGRIVASGRSSVAIVAGEVFDLEVAGEMKLARMERRQRVDGVEEWSTAQGHPLHGNNVRRSFAKQ